MASIRENKKSRRVQSPSSKYVCQSIFVNFNSEQFYRGFLYKIARISMTIVIIILFPKIPIIVEWFIFFEILSITSSDDRLTFTRLPSFYNF